MKYIPIICLLGIILLEAACLKAQERKRARAYGFTFGVMQPGQHNAITDVSGVSVGHCTLNKETSIRTGVTAVLPHPGNVFQKKVPAAIFIGNGFGKLAGSTQVMELGNMESPIILTNTLNVGTGIDAVIKYTLSQKGNEHVQSVNAVVGETNDGYLNDIRAQAVTIENVFQAISQADSGDVPEGNVGAGTGTVCFGFKGGIGTSSRKLPASMGSYTVGVLVQSNFGGILQIDGYPIGKEMKKFSFSDQLLNNVDGSCMMVVATDAPLDARNLARLAKRAFMGLAKTGGIASNGSGDYVIAFSTDANLRVTHETDHETEVQELVNNDYTSPLFMAAIEATEEAIINSLFAAQDMTGIQGHQIKALPIEEVLKISHKYNQQKAQ